MTEAAADWQNYKSPAPREAQQGQELTNPGLPQLNNQDEYVFKLEKVILKRGVGNTFKEGTTADRFYTVWRDETHGTITMINFRVDKLVYNSKSVKFQSPVLTFFNKIGLPIPEGEEPNWGNLFILGMRIRGRVEPKLQNGKPTGAYNIEIATVRKFQQ